MTEDDSRSEVRFQNVGHVLDAELNARTRLALHEARTEAVVVLTVDVALLGGLAAIDVAKGWDIIDLPWWAWLLLAAPALLLIVLLLVAPLAELSPGRVRNVGVALLGLLVASDAVAVGVLLAALAGSSAASLSAGELLVHGAVVWLPTSSPSGCCSGCSTRADRACGPSEGGTTQTSSSRRTPSASRLEPTTQRLPLRVAHQCDRGQPDGHDAAHAPGQGPHGRRVAHFLRRCDPCRRPRRERAVLTTTAVPSAMRADCDGCCVTPDCARVRVSRHSVVPEQARMTSNES